MRLATILAILYQGVLLLYTCSCEGADIVKNCGQPACCVPITKSPELSCCGDQMNSHQTRESSGHCCRICLCLVPKGQTNPIVPSQSNHLPSRDIVEGCEIPSSVKLLTECSRLVLTFALDSSQLFTSHNQRQAQIAVWLK